MNPVESHPFSSLSHPSSEEETHDFVVLGEAFAELSTALFGASQTLLLLGENASPRVQPYPIPREMLCLLGDTFSQLSQSLSRASEGLLLSPEPSAASSAPSLHGYRCGCCPPGPSSGN
ncbi:MAG: hypothetical protein QM796_22120 [Chthoniobacteraceae bacterium]